eukprot:6496279-Heterocapsa_arctica.AAC.1
MLKSGGPAKSCKTKGTQLNKIKYVNHIAGKRPSDKDDDEDEDNNKRRKTNPTEEVQSEHT